LVHFMDDDASPPGVEATTPTRGSAPVEPSPAPGTASRERGGAWLRCDGGALGSGGSASPTSRAPPTAERLVRPWSELPLAPANSPGVANQIRSAGSTAVKTPCTKCCCQRFPPWLGRRRAPARRMDDPPGVTTNTASVPSPPKKMMTLVRDRCTQAHSLGGTRCTADTIGCSRPR
jgi:hypothetical protein